MDVVTEVEEPIPSVKEPPNVISVGPKILHPMEASNVAPTPKVMPAVASTLAMSSPPYWKAQLPETEASKPANAPALIEALSPSRAFALSEATKLARAPANRWHPPCRFRP